MQSIAMRSYEVFLWLVHAGVEVDGNKKMSPSTFCRRQLRRHCGRDFTV